MTTGHRPAHIDVFRLLHLAVLMIDTVSSPEFVTYKV